MIIPKFYIEKKNGKIFNWTFEWLGRSINYVASPHFQYKGHPFCYTFPDRRDKRFTKDIWFGGRSKWGTSDV